MRGNMVLQYNSNLAHRSTPIIIIIPRKAFISATVVLIHFRACGVCPTTLAAYLLVSSTSSSHASWAKNLQKRSSAVQEGVTVDGLFFLHLPLTSVSSTRYICTHLPDGIWHQMIFRTVNIESRCMHCIN